MAAARPLHPGCFKASGTTPHVCASSGRGQAHLNQHGQHCTSALRDQLMPTCSHGSESSKAPCRAAPASRLVCWSSWRDSPVSSLDDGNGKNSSWHEAAGGKGPGSGQHQPSGGKRQDGSQHETSGGKRQDGSQHETSGGKRQDGSHHETLCGKGQESGCYEALNSEAVKTFNVANKGQESVLDSLMEAGEQLSSAAQSGHGFTMKWGKQPGMRSTESHVSRAPHNDKGSITWGEGAVGDMNSAGETEMSTSGARVDDWASSSWETDMQRHWQAVLYGAPSSPGSTPSPSSSGSTPSPSTTQEGTGRRSAAGGALATEGEGSELSRYVALHNYSHGKQAVHDSPASADDPWGTASQYRSSSTAGRSEDDGSVEGVAGVPGAWAGVSSHAGSTDGIQEASKNTPTDPGVHARGYDVMRRAMKNMGSGNGPSNKETRSAVNRDADDSASPVPGSNHREDNSSNGMSNAKPSSSAKHAPYLTDTSNPPRFQPSSLQDARPDTSAAPPSPYLQDTPLPAASRTPQPSSTHKPPASAAARTPPPSPNTPAVGTTGSLLSMARQLDTTNSTLDSFAPLPSIQPSAPLNSDQPPTKTGVLSKLASKFSRRRTPPAPTETNMATHQDTSNAAQSHVGQLNQVNLSEELGTRTEGWPKSSEATERGGESEAGGGLDVSVQAVIEQQEYLQQLADLEQFLRTPRPRRDTSAEEDSSTASSSGGTGNRGKTQVAEPDLSHYPSQRGQKPVQYVMQQKVEDEVDLEELTSFLLQQSSEDEVQQDERQQEPSDQGQQPSLTAWQQQLAQHAQHSQQSKGKQDIPPLGPVPSAQSAATQMDAPSSVSTPPPQPWSTSPLPAQGAALSTSLTQAATQLKDRDSTSKKNSREQPVAWPSLKKKRVVSVDQPGLSPNKPLPSTAKPFLLQKAPQQPSKREPETRTVSVKQPPHTSAATTTETSPASTPTEDQKDSTDAATHSPLDAEGVSGQESAESASAMSSPHSTGAGGASLTLLQNSIEADVVNSRQGRFRPWAPQPRVKIPKSAAQATDVVPVTAERIANKEPEQQSRLVGGEFTQHQHDTHMGAAQFGSRQTPSSTQALHTEQQSSLQPEVEHPSAATAPPGAAATALPGAAATALPGAADLDALFSEQHHAGHPEGTPTTTEPEAVQPLSKKASTWSTLGPTVGSAAPNPANEPEMQSNLLDVILQDAPAASAPEHTSQGATTTQQNLGSGTSRALEGTASMSSAASPLPSQDVDSSPQPSAAPVRRKNQQGMLRLSAIAPSAMLPLKANSASTSESSRVAGAPADTTFSTSDVHISDPTSNGSTTNSDVVGQPLQSSPATKRQVQKGLAAVGKWSEVRQRSRATLHSLAGSKQLDILSMRGSKVALKGRNASPSGATTSTIVPPSLDDLEKELEQQTARRRRDSSRGLEGLADSQQAASSKIQAQNTLVSQGRAERRRGRSLQGARWRVEVANGELTSKAATLQQTEASVLLKPDETQTTLGWREGPAAFGGAGWFSMSSTGSIVGGEGTDSIISVQQPLAGIPDASELGVEAPITQGSETHWAAGGEKLGEYDEKLLTPGEETFTGDHSSSVSRTVAAAGSAHHTPTAEGVCGDAQQHGAAAETDRHATAEVQGDMQAQTVPLGATGTADKATTNENNSEPSDESEHANSPEVEPVDPQSWPQWVKRHLPDLYQNAYSPTMHPSLPEFLPQLWAELETWHEKGFQRTLSKAYRFVEECYRSGSPQLSAGILFSLVEYLPLYPEILQISPQYLSAAFLLEAVLPAMEHVMPDDVDDYFAAVQQVHPRISMTDNTCPRLQLYLRQMKPLKVIHPELDFSVLSLLLPETQV